MTIQEDHFVLIPTSVRMRGTQRWVPLEKPWYPLSFHRDYQSRLRKRQLARCRTTAPADVIWAGEQLRCVVADHRSEAGDRIHELAGLALIKQTTEAVAAGVVRDLLLLAWSASVAKLNRTFLSARGRAPSRGGSSIFSLYRYKVASRCVKLPLWATFQGRFANVLAAKKEVVHWRDYRQQQWGAHVPWTAPGIFKSWPATPRLWTR